METTDGGLRHRAATTLSAGGGSAGGFYIVETQDTVCSKSAGQDVASIQTLVSHWPDPTQLNWAVLGNRRPFWLVETKEKQTNKQTNSDGHTYPTGFETEFRWAVRPWVSLRHYMHWVQ